MKYSIRNIVYLLAVFALLILTNSCMEEAPTEMDGQGELIIKSFFKNSENDQKQILSSAKIILSSEYGINIYITDENGSVKIKDLPTASYSIAVRKLHPERERIFYTENINNVELYSDESKTVELTAFPISSSGIAINEIYAGGPPNSGPYVTDQFIELFNPTDSILYLDGKMICRLSGNNIRHGYKGSGADEHNDDDIDGVTYAFKFPGNPGEKNHEIKPGEFLLIAQTPGFHNKDAEWSVDLRNADWEFHNQYNPGELNYESIPDLLNMITDEKSDFMLNLSSDVVVITDGKDADWSDGLDIDGIIDGVQYKTDFSDPTTIDERVDVGFVKSSEKYSGKSMQRRTPGIDTNNGTLDWEILDKPTPGFHK